MKISSSVTRTATTLCWLVLMSISMTGCNNSSDSALQPPQLQQGNIVNTRIAGLSYTTETQSGVTDVDGGFSFLAGETIRFSFGDTVLGDVAAKTQLNWFELIGLGEIPVGYRDISRNQYGKNDAPSLSRLGAIASILETVDDDRDSSNGINITPAVATMFSGVDIDLEYTNSPAHDVSFERLLRHAVRNGELTARELKSGSFALQEVYDNHGIDPQFVAYRRAERDNDNDGQTDYVHDLTFSVEGLPTRDEIDDDADGSPNTVAYLTYDAEGQLLSYTADNNADGIDDRISIFQYDAIGKRASITTDFDGDGIAEMTELLTVNDDALRVRREVTDTIRGRHTIEVWTTDSVGNRTMYDRDDDGDGSFDVFVALTYDEALGPWITRSQDDNRDGTFEEYRERDYDANELLVRDAIDTGANGVFNWIELRTYDSNSRRTQLTRDTNGDGGPDYIVLTTYDANGNTTRTAYDTDGDGSFDSIFSSTFDTNDNLVLNEVDNDGDGNSDRITSRLFNSDGNMIEQAYDQNADGTIDSYIYNIYDASGYLIRTDRDDDANGSIDRVDSKLDWRPITISAGFN